MKKAVGHLIPFMEEERRSLGIVDDGNVNIIFLFMQIVQAWYSKQTPKAYI